MQRYTLKALTYYTLNLFIYLIHIHELKFLSLSRPNIIHLLHQSRGNISALFSPFSLKVVIAAIVELSLLSLLSLLWITIVEVECVI